MTQLPGIVSGGDRGGLLFIRGGAPAERFGSTPPRAKPPESGSSHAYTTTPTERSSGWWSAASKTKTTIAYELSNPGRVDLSIFDLTGRSVTTLVSGLQSADRNVVVVDAAGLSSGIYIYRLEAGGVVETRRMVVVK